MPLVSEQRTSGVSFYMWVLRAWDSALNFCWEMVTWPPEGIAPSGL